MDRAIEPFLPAPSSRPARNPRDEFILLSIAVGDRTLDDLFEDLGIPKPELDARLRRFEILGLVKVYRGTYYPPPWMGQGKGTWSKNVTK
jgi:hypothetical protein